MLMKTLPNRRLIYLYRSLFKIEIKVVIFFQCHTVERDTASSLTACYFDGLEVVDKINHSFDNFVVIKLSNKS